jgi:hypothetical protein
LSAEFGAARCIESELFGYDLQPMSHGAISDEALKMVGGDPAAVKP